VPQFMLRRFCIPGTEQVYVFDKTNSRTFKTNTKNVAAESRFYDVELEDATVSLEPGLSRLESSVSDILESVISKASLASISDDEKRLVSLFVAIQLIRVRSWRQTSIDATKQLEQQLLAWGFDPKEVANFEVMDEEDAKRHALGAISEADHYAPLLFGKDWFLFRSPDDQPFVISDNPVTLQNVMDRSLHSGGLGLASRGIEIHLPLSPQLSLAMYCPTNREAFGTTLEKFWISEKSLPSLPDELKKKAASLKGIAEAIDTGLSAESAEGTANLNSLQVGFSERFIFSCGDDFDFAERMIEKSERFRKGPRMTVGFPDADPPSA